ncbi:MAG: RNA polymerase sigma factor [Deltaproteobacteria bacterium]
MADPLQAVLASGEDAADPRVALLAAHYGPALFRLARTFVRSDAVAEEVVQETWLAILEGLPRFRGECSLKVYVFTVLGNRARSRAKVEARSVPFSALGGDGDDPGAVDPALVHAFDGAGHWLPEAAPRAFRNPEDELLSKERLRIVARALEALPGGQRAAVLLRDVEGLDAKEACNILGVSETNQRVLLHRGRCALRAAIAAAERELP